MSGTISEEEATRILQANNAVAQRHTDVLLRVDQTDGKCGLASALHLRRGDEHLLVTCHHVLRPSHDYFSCPTRLMNSQVDEEKKHKVSPLEFLFSDASPDLAVFRCSEEDVAESGKSAYDLARSDWCTFEQFSSEVGLGTTISGLWGEMASGFVYPDGLVYLDAPLYTALGPIASVRESEIVADMAEVSVLFRNDGHAKVRGTQPTGGIRDLTGTSGSGLWVMADESPTLLGVVRGRTPDCPPDKHLMRFAPVWLLREWLDSVLS